MATAAVALLLVAALAQAESLQINASVLVVCPFSVSLQVPPLYPINAGEIPANYTASSSCPLTEAPGTLTITDQGNSVVMYTTGVSIPHTGADTYTYNLLIPTRGLSNTLYDANVAFDSGSVSASNSFLLVDGANVSITSFTAPSSVTESSSISFGLGMQNYGGLSSGPISLFLNITGPNDYNSIIPLAALSPGQSSNTFVILYNVTGSPGDYAAHVVITYNSFEDYVSNSMASLTYSVTPPTPPSPPPSPNSGGSGGAPGPTAPQLPQITFTYIPLLNSGLSDQVTQSQICFKNTGTSSIGVAMGVAPEYSNILKLSTYSITLSPKQSLCTQTYLKAGANISTGVYTIPVHVNATYQAGKSENTTVYLTYSVYRLGSGQPIVASQVSMANNGTSASGVVSIIAPENTSLTNATLVQWLPLSVAQNASDITVYGLASNITIENNSYRISSKIGSLPAGQTVYEYYSVEGPTDTQLLLKSQYELYTETPPGPQGVLRVAGISAPAITGANGLITVSVLYTGASPSNMTLFMVAPPQIGLLNDTQTVAVLPNQLVTRKFKIISHPSNGTYLLQLLIKTSGANLTYGVPVVISPSTGAEKAKAQTYLPLYVRVGIFIALIITVLLLLWLLFRGGIGRQRYSKERVGHLISIREQIKRGDE